MTNELTNLLPIERQRAVRKDYFFRVGVVVTTAMVLLVLAMSMLLLPTYMYLVESISLREEQLADIESTFSSDEELALSTRLSSLSNDTASLVALSNIKSISTAVRSILAISRPGITITNLVYTPSAEAGLNTVTISGSSLTRTALRNYQLALQGAPTVLSAALPVSAYAKDSDIAFSIKVTLAP